MASDDWRAMWVQPRSGGSFKHFKIISLYLIFRLQVYICLNIVNINIIFRRSLSFCLCCWLVGVEILETANGSSTPSYSSSSSWILRSWSWTSVFVDQCQSLFLLTHYLCASVSFTQSTHRLLCRSFHRHLNCLLHTLYIETAMSLHCVHCACHVCMLLAVLTALSIPFSASPVSATKVGVRVQYAQHNKICRLSCWYCWSCVCPVYVAHGCCFQSRWECPQSLQPRDLSVWKCRTTRTDFWKDRLHDSMISWACVSALYVINAFCLQRSCDCLPSLYSLHPSWT